jgi:hypothetical protein
LQQRCLPVTPVPATSISNAFVISDQCFVDHVAAEYSGVFDVMVWQRFCDVTNCGFQINMCWTLLAAVFIQQLFLWCSACVAGWLAAQHYGVHLTNMSATPLHVHALYIGSICRLF